MEANSFSTQRPKIIKWHEKQKTIIPLEAILNERSIEVHFLTKVSVSSQVFFLIKDQHGNILLQDNVNPSEEGIHIIDLFDFRAGHYEIHYIEEDLILVGEFDITNK